MRINLKLQTKLLLVSVGMIFCFGAAVLVQFEKGQKAQRNEVEKGFSMYSSNLNASLSQVFFGLYNNPQGFIRNKAFQKKDFGELNFILNELTSLYPMYDMIIYTDMDGNYIASNSISPEGKQIKIEDFKKINFKDEEWFKQTKNYKYVQDMSKKIFGSYVGKWMVDDKISKVYGKDKIGLHISTVVENDYAEPVGVITTFANVRWVEGELLNLYESLEKSGKKTANVAFLDKEGKTISYFDPHNNGDKKDFIYDLKELQFQPYKLPSGHKKEEYLSTEMNMAHKKFVDALGWQVKINMDKDEAFAGINAAARTFYMTFAVMLVICGVIAWWVSSRLSKKLLQMAINMRQTSEKTQTAAVDLNRASNSVSQSSTEQSGAIQETVSTLDEFSSMIEMSSKNAQTSLDYSIKSKKAADQGKDVVARVVESINLIKESNEAVLRQTREGNEKIRDIVKVINEISEKTKVINDIVFQTKLLSFNASVEAARAGEHGKGFAVVAEEVGNLAVMSGNAAKEIFEMLNGSIVRVQEIVSETQGKIENLMVNSTTKINSGISIVGECDEALNNIAENVEAVNSLIAEVVAAAKEQEQGVQAVTAAMNEIEKSTNLNNQTARETLEYSEGLTRLADELENVVLELEAEIKGSKVEHTDDDHHDHHDQQVESHELELKHAS